MYLSYYGLARSPFEIGPEPEPFFESPAHLDALWGLIYGVTENRGFISLTGDAGVGKTTTLYAAVQSLGLTHPSLLWIEHTDPRAEPANLLAKIIDRLNLPTALTPEGDLVPIRNRLLRLREAGKSLIIVIDAAQDLDAALLGFIERLAALNEDASPLFLMIFIGLPSWNEILRRPEHRELDRRVALRLVIPNLTPRLARDYIEFRVTSAGGMVAEVMSGGATRTLIGMADGNPGRIHALADRALGLGLANRHQPIAASDIRAARRALDPASFPSGLRSWMAVRKSMAIGFAALVFMTAGLGWQVLHPKFSASATNPTETAASAQTGLKSAAVPVTVAPGETMQTLLRRYGLPETGDEVTLVQALNPRLGNSDAIHAGQVLLLPAPAIPATSAPAASP